MNELKQAEAFKDMVIEASSPMIAPHIEGVFAVFKGRYNPQSEWISVNDRLPNDYGAYWTFNGDDAHASVIQQRVHMYDPKMKAFNSHTVTHWMPLPTPPKGV